MNKTSIDWPSLSYTWNPIVGCSNGCYYCYAKRINDRFGMIPDFSIPQLFKVRLKDPLKIKKPSTIFVGSMCDILDGEVKTDWIDQIIDVCQQTPRHTYMFLSKQPQRYHRWDWPSNCWLGTTVESHGSIYRISWLDFPHIKANKKFVSVEPILGVFEPEDFSMADLVIVGADSTTGAARPERKWVDSIKHPNVYYKKNILQYFRDLKNKNDRT